MQMPLFPLNALLCPQGRIPLRLFEPRYLDMASQCLRSDTGFIVVLLREGEDGDASETAFYDVGTLATIVDFGPSPQRGILDITVEGQYRADILSTARQENGLWLGEISRATEEHFVAVPDRYKDLKAVLQALIKHPLVKALNMDINFQDGRQLGWRLTELLPFGNKQKQYLFELDDPLVRLDKIADKLAAMVS